MSTTESPQAKKRKMSPEVSAVAPAHHLLIKRLSDKAKLPSRGSALSAGYDLYSAEKKTVPAHGKALIDTQISIAVPVGHYGRVAPRSGLASKFMIDTGAGVIDADYRGVVFVLLFNLSDKDFEAQYYTVEEGDRVAQLIIEKIYNPEVLEVLDLGGNSPWSWGFRIHRWPRLSVNEFLVFE
ncbi:dUTPase-like protein [Mycena floridula]|nr:dUTPase-like protein [Mycena floridula]